MFTGVALAPIRETMAARFCIFYCFSSTFHLSCPPDEKADLCCWQPQRLGCRGFYVVLVSVVISDRGIFRRAYIPYLISMASLRVRHL